MAAMRLTELTQSQLSDFLALDYTRYLKCVVAANANAEGAAELFAERYPTSVSKALITKAAVAAGTTTDATWAGPLAQVPSLAENFANVVRVKEVPSQLVGTIRAPFNMPIPVYTPAAAPANLWTQQGLTKRAMAFSFTSATVAPFKVAAIVTVTAELIKTAVSGTEQALQTILTGQLASAVNKAFLDPTAVAVAKERPGSMTSRGTGVWPANSAVTDATNVLAALVAARPNVENPTLIMDPAAASALIATGNQPGLTLTGGSALGAKVIVS